MASTAGIALLRGFATSSSSAVKISPAARYILNNRRINLAQIQGSGKAGMITKGDVLLALEAQKGAGSASIAKGFTPVSAPASPPSPAPSAPAPSSTTAPVNSRYTDIPNSNMRKVIAKRLTESKNTVPHSYSTVNIPLDAALAYRKTLQKDLGVQVSVNDLVIKAAALSLREVKEVALSASKTRTSEVASPSIDISVAVATPAGLITPIVTNADQRGLVDLSRTVKGLAERARANKLKPEEYQGGVFSISNLGMFGVSVFSAVINPPQGCILAVGAGQNRLTVTKDNQLKPVTEMSVQLSFDRRLLSEAAAAQFLQVFKTFMSNPSTLAL